jgi:hypothetical protein
MIMPQVPNLCTELFTSNTISQGMSLVGVSKQPTDGNTYIFAAIETTGIPFFYFADDPHDPATRHTTKAQ